MKPTEILICVKVNVFHFGGASLLAI